RPMRALGLTPSEPAPPVTLTPAVGGAFHWIGSAALRFDAVAPLPPATAFHLEIPAGTPALDGTGLAQPFGLAFVPPRPAVVASTPSDGATDVLPEDTLALAFNAPVSDAEIRRAVSLRAGKRRAPLDFTLDRQGPAAVTLVPARPLPV